MRLETHPYGKFYYHIPTDKVVCLSNPSGFGKWHAHYQYRESLIVHEDDLRIALQAEIVKHYPKHK